MARRLRRICSGTSVTNLNLEQLEKVLRRVLNQQPSPSEFLAEAQSALNFYELENVPTDLVELVVNRVANTKDNLRVLAPHAFLPIQNLICCIPLLSIREQLQLLL